jgi:uncharacterized protein YbbC (DUF1343 family)/CubicO group peptidase (beta-lactamase class C family)
VAWTWYVIIGALVTFAVGSLASLVFRKQSARTPSATTALLLLIVILSGASRPCDAQSKDTEPAKLATTAPTISTSDPSTPDFSAVSAAINTAIAQKKLPGAVVVIGHNGKVVFRQAYGVRKLAGEPGLDGKPSAAEPMTTDTIFDMASLTKCLVTATAVMQWVEAGKVDVDAPVVKYLPEFAANGKQAVTIRDLLTHYSGLPPDVDLKDDWGLKAPDRAEGMRRAMNSKLTTPHGTHFEYSDINYIVLGALVEKLSGEALDVYAQKHIFAPLKMTHTSFFTFNTACGADKLGAAIVGDHETRSCPYGTWYAWGYHDITAPTAHDDQGTVETNPNFDHLLRGTVHDPTTRRMGGVAGQAGVFSTAADVALFAQALLDKLLYDKGPFPLKNETLVHMTRPEIPLTAQGVATVFTQDGTTTTGLAWRGFGWDINSAFSRPRGTVFPTYDPAHYSGRASFGHTGFTGTSLWMDPASDTYVILLSNAIHPRGNPPISALRGEVATAAAKALGITFPPPVGTPQNPCQCTYCEGCPGLTITNQPAHPDTTPAAPLTAIMQSDAGSTHASRVLTGIDVLEATNFAALKAAAARNGGHLRIGLLTNQTGLDAQGRRTIDLLRGIGDGVELTTLFSPEHGIFGAKDSTNIGQEVDPTTGLKVISLYGAKDADRRPKPEDLKNLDAVVIDLQDAGVRFYTYETVLGYFLEAAKNAAMQHHPLKIVVMDRPPLIGGEQVQGPVSDTDASYINYMPLPVRHGMTIGELSEYMNGEHGTIRSSNSLSASAIPEVSGAGLDKKHAGSNTQYEWSPSLIVVRMQNWHRDEYFDATGVPWVNPSPNLRSVTEATLYPALGMMDATNVSVGRGTATPFEVFGAGATTTTKDAPAIPAWFDGNAVASYLTARKIPGVAFAAATFTVADDANHYPYHGQTIQGVRLTVTDRVALDSPELGIEILSALHHLYPVQFKLDKAAPLVANFETMAALARGDDPRTIAAGWAQGLADFNARRAQYLIYH